MDVKEFAETDRHVAEVFLSTSDRTVRLDVIHESIEVAEDLAGRTSSLDELADVALRCAASYVLLNQLLGGDEKAATGAATWAARAAAATLGRATAEVGCLPQAAAMVAAAVADLPTGIHHQAVMRMHGWLVRLGSALEEIEASREQAEVAWRVALAARGVVGLEEITSLARSAAVASFRDAGDTELAVVVLDD